MTSRVLIIAGASLALMAGTANAATINVDTTVDELNADSDCSLREAVQAARLNDAISGCAKGQGSPDTIKLKNSNYPLGPSSTNEGSNANGDLDVTGGGPVTVVGKADTSITDTTDEDRIFDVIGSNANLTLDTLRVSTGDVTPLPFLDARGGNVRVTDGRLTMLDVDVAGGEAHIGGGVFAAGEGRIDLSNTLFDVNDATGAGGALALQDTARGTVKRSLFQLNGVDSSVESVEGGAIAHAGNKLTVTDSTLQGSSATATGAAHAAFGGIIWANGNLVLNRSLLQGSSTSADEDNVGEHGGALFVQDGEVEITNSTIFNTRAGEGGDNDGSGGAVFVADGAVEVSHTTIDATEGTSTGDAFGATGGTLVFRQSLIEDAEDPCAGTPIFSGGYNVTEDDDAGCDFVGTDAPDVVTALGVVSDNGGPTDTIPIATNSVAKNHVPKGVCKTHTGLVDQRKFVRPKGKKCDAGAFELGAKKP